MMLSPHAIGTSDHDHVLLLLMLLLMLRLQDLQNLTQRFKSKQSASLQQAAYWADRDVLISAVQPPPSKPQQQQQEAAAGSLQSSIQDSKDTGSTDSSSSNAAAGDDQPGQQLGAEHQQDVAERAVRLSFAALQGVPQESPKVRWDTFYLLRPAVNCKVLGLYSSHVVSRYLNRGLLSGVVARSWCFWFGGGAAAAW